MRLALITHKFTRGDGQGRVNYELARAALAEGHTVYLLASEIAPELARHPRARAVPLRVSGLPGALLQNQLFAWKTTRWLRHHRQDIDVVHANGFVTWSEVDVSSCHFVHAAWVRSRFHTWHLRRDLYGLYQLLYSTTGVWLEQWSYRRARCIVAVSEQVKRELGAAGCDTQRLRVIPNGVDTDEYAPGAVVRASLGLPEGNLALFAGDLRTPRKNLDTLLRAMIHVRDLQLIVAGDVGGSPYPRLAQELGLAERVTFLGYRGDIPRLMQAADLFVFPSRYEACSLVLLEAAASGLPVVAGRSTGGAELLTPECSVLLEDCEDAQGLGVALERLCREPARLEAMGVAARRVALTCTWRVMAQRYLQLYREFLHPPQLRPAETPGQLST